MVAALLFKFFRRCSRRFVFLNGMELFFFGGDEVLAFRKEKEPQLPCDMKGTT